MQIELTKRFLSEAKKLSRAEAKAVDDALTGLPAQFGNPHVHGGSTVRVLKPPVYEARATFGLRIVFVRIGDMLKVDFVGNHDEVRAYLKNRS